MPRTHRYHMVRRELQHQPRGREGRYRQEAKISHGKTTLCFIADETLTILSFCFLSIFHPLFFFFSVVSSSFSFSFFFSPVPLRQSSPEQSRDDLVRQAVSQFVRCLRVNSVCVCVCGRGKGGVEGGMSDNNTILKRY